jgi:putative ABC transport system permease protein
VSLLWLAIQNLRSAPRRTALTSLGLSAAVAGALLFFGFTRHTYWGLAESFARGGGGHIQVAHADWFGSPAPELARTPVAELQAVQARLQDELGAQIQGMSLRRDFSGMVLGAEQSGVFLGSGSDPAVEAILAPLASPVAGVALAQGPPDGVVLGAPLAERVGVAPGDLVTLMVNTDGGLTNAADVEVVGLASTGSIELDRAFLKLPLPMALELMDGDTADVLVIALEDTSDTDALLAEVQARLPSEGGLVARPWHELAHYYIAVKALYDRIFGIFQALMVLVTALTLSHAVAAVVAERRAEIALLRVLGLKRRQILGLFVVEGGLLGLLGAAGGALLAELVSLVTRALGGLPMPPPPGFTVGYAAQFHLDGWGFLIVLPLTVLAAMVASAIPSWQASRGALSKALVGLALLLAVWPAGAGAGPLEDLDAARALPPGQVCSVVMIVEDGRHSLVWDVQMQGGRVLARSSSLPADKAQAVLTDGAETWLQTASMKRPLKVSASHRMMGQLAVADLLSPSWASSWELVDQAGGSLQIRAREGALVAYSSGTLVLVEGQLASAEFAGPSGRVVRQARWSWSEDGVLVEVSEPARPEQVTRLRASAPVCVEGLLEVGPEGLAGLLAR